MGEQSFMNESSVFKAEVEAQSLEDPSRLSQGKNLGDLGAKAWSDPEFVGLEERIFMEYKGRGCLWRGREVIVLKDYYDSDLWFM